MLTKNPGLSSEVLTVVVFGWEGLKVGSCFVCYHLIICFSICLTKLDILDNFDEVKIGVAYKLHGKELESMPGKIF